MSKKIIRLPIVLFCLPVVYFSLVLDNHYHSSIGFFISLFFALAIGFYSKAAHQMKWWLAGNLLSTLLSLLLQANHPEWHFFYQPFHPTILVFGLSLLYLIPQIVGIVWASFLRISLPQ
ncbi:MULTISPECIES: hypothetical protein [Enterococcus]|uniref:hypothetical protein n=1 Tax=Enterococcus TaxID=1350 RepID=UPI00065DDA65|nr:MULTISPECIES: hypothetical protein [Enterococcus]KAF1301261.1 hypothetical protein BAU16_09695 [Enterococcus sp. JM9B]